MPITEAEANELKQRLLRWHKENAARVASRPGAVGEPMEDYLEVLRMEIKEGRISVNTARRRLWERRLWKV